MEQAGQVEGVGTEPGDGAGTEQVDGVANEQEQGLGSDHVEGLGTDQAGQLEGAGTDQAGPRHIHVNYCPLTSQLLPTDQSTTAH